MTRYQWSTLILVSGLLVATAAPVGAVTIAFTGADDDARGVFDALGARGTDWLAQEVYVGGMLVFAEKCTAGICESPGSLDLSWSVGPLIGFIAGDPAAPGYVPGVGSYRYGPGILTVDAEWPSSLERGVFVAEIQSLEIDLPRQGLFGLDAEFRMVLGSGVFHPWLARSLGVARRTSSGSYDLDFDGAYFDDGAGYLLGDITGWEPWVDAAVPEPALTPLALFGLLSVVRRRRRREPQRACRR